MGCAIVLRVAGYENIPVSGGYVIACLAAVYGAEIEWSVDEPVFVAELDPLTIWHEISDVGHLWRNCRWSEEVVL